MTGDSYKRRAVSAGHYQCGCEWVGQRLIECAFHKQATKASVAEFERKRQAALREG